MEREYGLHEITRKYTAKAIEVPSEPGYWNTSVVEIYEGENKIGSYGRNYPALYNTFMPFVQNGREYALYSPKYTCTRVMELPSCKDICGEENDPYGFCPTGYYVPYVDQESLDDVIENYEDEHKKFFQKIIGPNGQFGFVCGCHWGDDSFWKIQFLDLSKISEGILKRDDRFGYLELLGSSEDLHKVIQVNEFTEEEYAKGEVNVRIASCSHFKLKGDKIEW